MKKILFLLFVLNIVCTYGQTIEVTYDPDAISQFQGQPIEYLKNFEAQKIVGFQLNDSKKPVELQLFAKVFTQKGLWQEIALQNFKLFPGNIFFPGNILFPGTILDEFPKGKCVIIFEVQPVQTEQLFLLRKLPGRIPIVFNN